ncbi:MAG: radical SAM protein, partial [Candidatus Zixiibacteriota bacterium]
DILVNIGAKQWRIQMTTSTGRMRDHSDLVMSLDNYPRFVDKVIELTKDDRIKAIAGENIGYYGCKGYEMIGKNTYYGCFAGTRVAGICSNGNVKGCLSMQEQFVEGNIRDSSFTEIWNNPDSFAYNRKFTKETATGFCHDCRYLPLCRGGCATTSVSATGERANNPFCTYHIEKEQGIECKDPFYIAQLLESIRDTEEEMAKARQA